MRESSRRVSHGGDSDDSYLASLSDLIIGVLFVFIILLMAFALNYKAAQTDADDREKDLKEQNERLSDAQKDRKALLEHIKQTLKAQGIPVEIDAENGILRLPEALLFDSGRAEFRAGGAAALKVVASNLATILPCYSSNSMSGAECQQRNPRKRQLEAIFIEGHTDNIPINNASFRDNWDLSVARAKRTYLELTKETQSLETMLNERKEPLLSFSAYAERRPVATSDSDEARRKNRRIDLRFIMAIPRAMANPADLPGATGK